MGLGSKHNQGGISPVTPPTLARQLQSLPPMLHRLYPNTMPRCSKAPRGLFVLLRVDGIFTVTAISPSLWLRQCPNRCAIRAGRNLPDKEFRSRAPHVAMRRGPYLHLTIGGEMVGVWPLRIPGIETADDDSSSRSPERWCGGPRSRGASRRPSHRRPRRTSRSPPASR